MHLSQVQQMIGQVLHVTHVVKVQFRQDHFAWVHFNKDFEGKNPWPARDSIHRPSDPRNLVFAIFHPYGIFAIFCLTQVNLCLVATDPRGTM